MDKPFSIETFLHILENDDLYAIDETSFYFDDDPDEDDHMLGCIRDYDKPYWIGYHDITKPNSVMRPSLFHAEKDAFCEFFVNLKKI